ncbi:hypothetical protein [Sphingomonas faeni]|uniref:hypothetical protein n=1 Tax=Sphingomonas faeni TaxID=185950 RepID=UPI0020BF5B97|nr:hypothetical protein [Sphingomonas faeni]MCK8456827.1 hypothetical protein [Sphingomonas faeni]
MARLDDTYMVYWIDNTALERDMGKKKDERKRREREAEQRPVSAHGCAGDNAHDARKDSGKKNAGHTHDAPTPFAGIAAAVARQLATPAGRQVVAAGLTMAAAAISRQDMKSADRAARPAAPEPHVSPETPASPKAVAPETVSPEAVSPEAGAKPSTDQPTPSPYAGDTPEPPRGELPPEMAKVMGAVTAGLETLFAGFGKPRNGPPKN